MTDLLMFSLSSLEHFGIRVDFPDEPTTGGDMEWIFAAPLESGGGRYMRLILQAKRAKLGKSKGGEYWFYQHLDHGSPKGKQAETLVSHALTSPGGHATLPLYIFYHPESALTPASGPNPAIEGVNIVCASQIAPVVKGGCPPKKKRVSYWRGSFFPLSDLLCWPIIAKLPRSRLPSDSVELFTQNGLTATEVVGGFHPDLVVSRLQRRLSAQASKSADEKGAALSLEPANQIPTDVLRSINREVTLDDRKQLKHPRLIFSTTLRTSDPEFVALREASLRGR